MQSDLPLKYACLSEEELMTFKGDNSVKILLPLSEKGSTLKGKNLLPRWSKFFPFRVDSFSGVHEGKLEDKKVVSLIKNGKTKIYQVYTFPLTCENVVFFSG